MNGSSDLEPLRTIVVDDEQLAREELCFLLQQIAGIDVVAQAANGVEALKVIEAGFDSHVVFVTAFDQYAIDAFEVNAVDYLLKPVEQSRLSTAVDRARKRLAVERTTPRPTGGEEIERLVQLLAGRQTRREQLAIKVEDRFLLIHADEMVFASVEDEQIRVVTNSLSGTSNYRTLDELQARLDPAVFWRVHRSHLVNINKIKEIVPWFSRNYILKMKDARGSEIPVSRSQTRRLRDYLKL